MELNETYLIIAVSVINLGVIAMALLAFRDSRRALKATDDLTDLAKTQLK